DLRREKFTLTCRTDGRGMLQRDLDLTKFKANDVVNTEYELETSSLVRAEITDEKGGRTPCKVAFKGKGETPSPNWGPPSARQAVVNLFYSENGRFTVPINPGTY